MKRAHETIRKVKFWPYIIFFLLLAVCCHKPKDRHIRFPYYWESTMGLLENIDRNSFKEPSGITFHPIRKTLFVVSDEGELEEIDTDGNQINNVKIPGDLEAVTVHPKTGMLYIVVEGNDVILEFDPDSKEVIRRFTINREFNGNADFLQNRIGEYDSGIESLVFVADNSNPEGGTFFAGNQWDPPAVLEIEAPLKSRREKLSEAIILRVLSNHIYDPSAMCFDAARKVLCIVSDVDNIYYEMRLDGTIVVEFAFPGDNQEGIAWDEKGYLYIAQDTGGILKLRDLRKLQQADLQQ